MKQGHMGGNQPLEDHGMQEDFSQESKTMCDPPSGWKYGFPKEIPDNIQRYGEPLIEWLIENGYPEHAAKQMIGCKFTYIPTSSAEHKQQQIDELVEALQETTKETSAHLISSNRKEANAQLIQKHKR